MSTPNRDIYVRLLNEVNIAEESSTRIPTATLLAILQTYSNFIISFTEFVTHEGDTLHFYREELGLIKQRTHGRMNKIDMGIGLCHLYVTNPETFRFRKEANPPKVDGRIYVGSVMI